MSIDVDTYPEYFDNISIIGERRRAGEPIGYPPNNFVRRALEKQYISIVGALDLGDFETFLRESADLTYEETNEKMISLYGTPKELSAAAASEQRTLEDELAEVEEVARNRLEEIGTLSRKTQELEMEIKRLKEEAAKRSALPPAPSVPKPTAAIPRVAPVVPTPPVTKAVPIGYPPDIPSRGILRNIYSTVFGEFNAEDFEIFLRESAGLTLDEAKKLLSARYWQEIPERKAPEMPKPAPPAISPVKPATAKPGGLRPEEYVFIPPVPHGSMYQEIKSRISPFMNRGDVNDIANEIYDIIEHKEYNKLTKNDAENLLSELCDVSAKRSMTELERRISPPPKRIPSREEELAPGVRKKEREEVFIGRLPERVLYRYSTPRVEEVVSPFGEAHVRDYELEDTLRYNNILDFPKEWYELSSAEKLRRYGWNMGTAIIEEVVYKHSVTWESLHRDYGIPQSYIDGWIEYGESVGLIK